MPVTLNGTVTSNGLPTTVDFQYGRTTNYNRTVTATQSPLAAGAVASAVSAVLTGLQEGTLYHYRVVGVNSSGATYGSDMTFTPAAPPAAVDVTTAFKVALWTGTNVAGRAIPAIDLSGGGVVILRTRNGTNTPRMYLSANGTNVYGADTTTPGNTYATPPITFTASGFTLTDTTHNGTGANTYEAWCFKKIPRFCDVVTYTGNGTNRTISHNVGTVPSRLYVMRVDGAAGVPVFYDDSVGNTKDAGFSGAFVTSNAWNNTSPTTTAFTLSGASVVVNSSGVPFAAAILAQDLAFDGVIRVCNWTGNGSATGTIVTLGWQPQFFLGPKYYVGSGSTGGHIVADTTRTPGFTGADDEAYLGITNANDAFDFVAMTADGIQWKSPYAEVNQNAIGYTMLVVRAP